MQEEGRERVKWRWDSNLNVAWGDYMGSGVDYTWAKDRKGDLTEMLDGADHR